MEFADGYDTDQALSDLRHVSRMLAERTWDDDAQNWASDINQAADWFATGQFE